MTVYDSPMGYISYIPIIRHPCEKLWMAYHTHMPYVFFARFSDELLGLILIIQLLVLTEHLWNCNIPTYGSVTPVFHRTPDRWSTRPYRCGGCRRGLDWFQGKLKPETNGKSSFIMR
jgi:hypothetical protein